MKSSIAVTLGSGVFAVALGAYLFAYATTVRDPVEWKNGDVIVQDAKVAEMLPVFAGDGSGQTHVGIVEARPGGAVVIEAADKVRETPMREFLSRGVDGAFTVHRVSGLSDDQGKAVVAAARRHMSKPGDYFLRRNWEQLYSSELVRLAFDEVGVDVGRMVKLGKAQGDLGVVRSNFTRNWQANEDCLKRRFDMEQCWAYMIKQEIVTPASIAADARLTKIYEVAKRENKGFTLTRAAGDKDPPPAP